MKFKHQPVLNIFLNMDGVRHKIGRLAENERRIFFEYDKEFLSLGLNLSPFKLPFSASVAENSDMAFNGLFGLFNDSLPDGWGKLVLDRYIKSLGYSHNDLTVLDRLAFVGNGGMGALEYEPSKEVAYEVGSPINLDNLFNDVGQVFDGTTTDVLDQLRLLNGSSMGARPKVVALVSKDKISIVKGNTCDNDSQEAWLIKFPLSADADDMGLVEYKYSIAAKAAGIEMTETFLFPSKHSSGYFGTRRFDRALNKKHHVHTVSGLLHADFRTPNLDYETIMKAAHLLTKDIREVIKIFRLMVFNVKSGNRDDHSKNFAFIMDSSGKWKFAPAYDLTPSSGINAEHATMVNGKGKNIMDNDLFTVGEKFGLEKSLMIEIIQQVEAAVSDLLVRDKFGRYTILKK